MNSKAFFTIAAIFTTWMATAAPYTVINDDFVHEGCHYWKITIWDDAGTPQDHSDDIEITSDTMNDCDHQPGTDDPGDDPSEEPFTAVITEVDDMEFTNGISGTGYTVKILASDQTVLAEDKIFDFEGI